MRPAVIPAGLFFSTTQTNSIGSRVKSWMEFRVSPHFIPVA
jgi:hypothetical protein